MIQNITLGPVFAASASPLTLPRPLQHGTPVTAASHFLHTYANQCGGEPDGDLLSVDLSWSRFEQGTVPQVGYMEGLRLRSSFSGRLLWEGLCLTSFVTLGTQPPHNHWWWSISHLLQVSE